MSAHLNLFLFLIFFLFSCGQEKSTDDMFTKFEKSMELNKEIESNLIKKYNAVQLGGNGLKFTYQIQELLSNSDKALFVKGVLTDIIRRDDGYYLKIQDNFLSKEFLIEILLSNLQFKDITSRLKLDSSDNSGSFIFKPKSAISSSLLSIEPDLYYGETRDDDEIGINYQFDGTIFIIKGEMIDFYLNEKLSFD